MLRRRFLSLVVAHQQHWQGATPCPRTCFCTAPGLSPGDPVGSDWCFVVLLTFFSCSL
jgi:hypothetical protein